MLNTKTPLLAALGLILVASAAEPSHAATGNLQPNTTLTPPSTIIVDTSAPAAPARNSSFISGQDLNNSTPYFTGSLLSEVFQEKTANNPLGGLTFVYQVSNDGTSEDSIERFSTVNFTGFQTSAYYDTSSGTIAPVQAIRSKNNGDTVSFNLDTSAGSGIGNLDPGKTSDFLVIQTNAPSYVWQNAGLLDGSSATATTYGPAEVSPAPEPSAWAALGLSGLALTGLLVYKRNQKILA